MPGRILGAATSSSCGESIQFNYVATSVTQCIYIAQNPMVVTGISGRQRVNGGSGAQITFAKTPNGVASGNGTLLHTGIFDASTGGTADANQILALTTNANALILNAGDSISMIIGGTMTSAVGYVQVFIEPLT